MPSFGADSRQKGGAKELNPPLEMRSAPAGRRRSGPLMLEELGIVMVYRLVRLDRRFRVASQQRGQTAFRRCSRTTSATLRLQIARRYAKRGEHLRLRIL